MSSGLHRPARSPLCRATSPRPAKLVIHTHMISILLGCAPQAWQACDPQTFMTTAGPCPQACKGLHDLCWAAPLTPAQACMISTRTEPLKPAKPKIHRHAGSPLCQPTPFRYTRPTLQRPTSLPQLKASTRSPMGPHQSATCQQESSKPA
jgi:hypothetical protein